MKGKIGLLVLIIISLSIHFCAASNSTTWTIIDENLEVTIVIEGINARAGASLNSFPNKWKRFNFEASIGFPWWTLCFAISAVLRPRFGMALTCGEESGCALDVLAHINPSESARVCSGHLIIECNYGLYGSVCILCGGSGVLIGVSWYSIHLLAHLFSDWIH